MHTDRVHLGVSTDAAVTRELVAVAGRRVIDVGCGRGDLCRALAAAGATVLGMEPDVVQARRNATLAIEGVEFSADRAGSIPRPAGSQHLVVFNRSLHHVPVAQMDAALVDAVRVLEPGSGELLVFEPDMRGTWSQLLAPFHDETEVRAAALSALDRVAPRFDHRTERWYTAAVAFPDFDAFVARMAGVSHLGLSEAVIRTKAVRRLFEAGQAAQGFRFENLILVRLYRSGVRSVASGR
jgi:ubiquinone/menaquinone biosynthesis C-methylase UbiE